MSDILSQIEEIQGNVRDIKATWGNTIMTLDNIKSSLKAYRQKAIDDAYQKGLSRGYKDGYEAGQHEATTLEYQQGLEEGKKQAKVQAHLDVCHDIERVAHGNYQKGLNDAWEAAKRICTNWMISDQTLAEIFGQCKDIDTIMHENTAQEAINKLKAYEDRQKADDEIKVGDEVCFVFAGGETIEPFIVFSIKDDNGKKYYEGIQTSDGRWVNGGLKYYKTGRHFPQVAELIKAMKEGAE